MNTKRRDLVLTDETARHPFRAGLPPHLRSGVPATAMGQRWPAIGGGLRDFLAAYCAAFVVVMTFIA